MTPASCQPYSNGALHFVECAFGSGAAFIERDSNEMDLETTIRDIASGQIEKPIRVLAVFAEEAFCRDVTEDVARAIFERHSDEPFANHVADFLEKHLPDRIAVQLRRAA